MIELLALVFALVLWSGVMVLAALFAQWIALTLLAIHLSFWTAFFVLYGIRLIIIVLFK